MTRQHEDYPEDSELGNPTVVHNHYTQQKNGNGDLNKIVWGSAAVLAVTILAITGYVGVKTWTMSESVARLEAQMTIVLQRLPP